MDRVSESLLAEFSSEHNLEGLPESKQFENFSAYVTTRKHFSGNFNSQDIVIGAGGDLGVDAIAIIVNGTLITDIEDLNEIIELGCDLNAVFVFVQSATSSSFNVAKIGTFGFGVKSFFLSQSLDLSNTRFREFDEIQTELYRHSSKFRNGNPSCYLYYVTTGKWTDDPALVSRAKSVENDLLETDLLDKVQFRSVDARELQKLYRLTKNSVSKEFHFDKRIPLPEMPGVKEAYIGFLPVKEFVSLIQDESGDIISGLFCDNVRDWLEFNPVNEEIRTTLKSDARSRFVLMNNGITIIARTLLTTGYKVSIKDYSIVNGCQTSHVLCSEIASTDESVLIPIRLIGTEDDVIINDIIKATNRQTAVTPEQLYALEEFPKALEIFFQTFQDNRKLYYERRTKQYDAFSVDKTRIITPSKMIKAYAAMFLCEPHRTTRNYASFKAKVGKEIFSEGHKMEPYYVSAFMLYRIETLFRKSKLDARFKPARFHILLIARCLANKAQLPPPNAHEMTRYCTPIMEEMWDQQRSEALIERSAAIVDAVLGEGNEFDRDGIRTEPFTAKVLAALGQMGIHSITKHSGPNRQLSLDLHPH